MSQQAVVDIVRQALMTALWLGLPLLVVGFVAGIVISLVQVVTSLQDAGFAAVPRLMAFLAAFVLLLPWMVNRLVSYTAALWADLGRYAR